MLAFYIKCVMTVGRLALSLEAHMGTIFERSLG